MIGVFMYKPISERFGLPVMWTMVGLSLAGWLLSVFCLPDDRFPLEDDDDGVDGTEKAHQKMLSVIVNHSGLPHSSRHSF